MSINFAMPPDADVLGRSYEEMQPWDPASTSIPLKLDRPPSLRDNAYAFPIASRPRWRHR